MTNSVNIPAQRIKELIKPFKYAYYYIQNQNIPERFRSEFTIGSNESFHSSKSEIEELKKRYAQYYIDFRPFERELRFVIEIYPTIPRWDFIEDDYAMALCFENELDLIVKKYGLKKVRPPTLLDFGYDPEIEG